MAGDHHSSDKIDDFLQDVGITEDKSSGPKGKFFHKLQQKRVLMQAARKELVPGIDGRLLRLVHQDVFFLWTQAAGVVACLEGGAVLHLKVMSSSRIPTSLRDQI